MVNRLSVIVFGYFTTIFNCRISIILPLLSNLQSCIYIFGYFKMLYEQWELNYPCVSEFSFLPRIFYQETSNLDRTWTLIPLNLQNLDINMKEASTYPFFSKPRGRRNTNACASGNIHYYQIKRAGASDKAFQQVTYMLILIRNKTPASILTIYM